MCYAMCNHNYVLSYPAHPCRWTYLFVLTATSSLRTGSPYIDSSLKSIRAQNCCQKVVRSIRFYERLQERRHCPEVWRSSTGIQRQTGETPFCPSQSRLDRIRPLVASSVPKNFVREVCMPRHRDRSSASKVQSGFDRLLDSVVMGSTPSDSSHTHFLGQTIQMVC